MLTRLRRHLTFANVTSLLALTVAVGTGGAYAANTIGSSDIIDGSVRSIDIQDEQVRRVDLDKNSVGAEAVIDGTLDASDVGKTSGSLGYNATEIEAGSCRGKIEDTGMNIIGDTILVSPTLAGGEGILDVSWSAGPEASEFIVWLCNHNPEPVNPPLQTFTYIVFDS